MLRASSQKLGETADLVAVMDGSVGSGIPCGAELVAFVEAVISRDALRIANAREALVVAAGPQAMVDAAGVISNFERMVRIADATGIGLGNFDQATVEIRDSLGIEAFRHHD